MSEPRASWGLGRGDEVAPGRVVTDVLGGGKRYEVFGVSDAEHGTAVAKVLRPDRAGDDRAHHALRREAALLGRVSHPGVLRGLDAVADGPRPHLLLERVDGPTLRARSRAAGPMDPDAVAAIGIRLAGALAHLADRGVVHLDVKPSNIVLADGPVLIDFSVARSLERAPKVGGVVGTDAYLAPEQTGVEGWRGLIGTAADVWGLGATLHRCLAGRRPFRRSRVARDSDDPMVRFPQLSRAPRELPHTVPAPLRDVVEAMLSRDPSARPSAAEVSSRLGSPASRPAP
jgi:serine/threonine protein kinase